MAPYRYSSESDYHGKQTGSVGWIGPVCTGGGWERSTMHGIFHNDVDNLTHPNSYWPEAQYYKGTRIYDYHAWDSAVYDPNRLRTLIIGGTHLTWNGVGVFNNNLDHDRTNEAADVFGTRLS